MEFQEECLLLANPDVPERNSGQDTPVQKLDSCLIKVKGKEPAGRYNSPSLESGYRKAFSRESEAVADEEHVKILKEKGVKAWNEWRKANPETRPDLSGADLSAADL